MELRIALNSVTHQLPLVVMKPGSNGSMLLLKAPEEDEEEKQRVTVIAVAVEEASLDATVATVLSEFYRKYYTLKNV